LSAKPRLLLVEDDRLIRETLSEVLREDGFDVATAGDGAEAMGRLWQAEPDLVLSDIRMPRMNGYELFERMRGTDQLREIPVIFLSAMAAIGDVRTGMALGADDYITKPFDPVDVCRSVRCRLKRAEELKAKIKRQELFITHYLPHELRTPLTGILGFASLMRDSAAEGRGLTHEETEEFGRYIEVSGQRLLVAADNLSLVRELGRKLEAGEARTAGVPMTAGWVETTRQQAERVVETYGRRPDLTLQIEPVPLRLPDAFLPRVFGQLVDNACKFSLPGTPLLVQGRREGARYHLSVTDRGRGMTAEQAKTGGIFEQFDRDKHEQQGLGLGLEIARRYARLAGAELVLRPAEPGLEAGFFFHGNA
jgi:two-component system sensor histidine kinase/response regulator